MPSAARYALDIIKGNHTAKCNYSGQLEEDAIKLRLGWDETGQEPACRENN